VLATVVVAAAMSVIVFRVSGYYFAILTFVVSQVINLCFTNLSITGGPSGLFAFSQASVLGLDVAKPVEMYRLSIVATVVVFVGVFLFRRSRLCRKANAVGENEPLARALGLRQQWIKRQVFVVSAIPVAISGALYATSVGAIQPGLFGPQVAIAVILMTLLGGSGSILGPLLGGAVYIVLPQALPLNPTVATGVVGILFILIIRVAPRGLWPAISEMAQWVVARLRGRARSRPPTTPPKRAPQATRPALAPSGEGSP
jgi:branched-chain amino acid transport system permease protein